MKISIEVTMSQEYKEGHILPFMGEQVVRKFFVDADFRWYDFIPHLWNGLTRLRSEDVLRALTDLARELPADDRH